MYLFFHILALLSLPIAILLLLRPCFSRMDILVWVRKKGGRDLLEDDFFPSFKEVQLLAVLIMTSEVEEANQFGSPDAARLRCSSTAVCLLPVKPEVCTECSS